MYVIGSHHVVEHGQTKALLRLENSAQVTAPVPRKPQQKLFLMATVSDVPDVTRQKIAVGARHRLCLRTPVSRRENER
jgi:hypothetical protein